MKKILLFAFVLISTLSAIGQGGVNRIVKVQYDSNGIVTPFKLDTAKFNLRVEIAAMSGGGGGTSGDADSLIGIPGNQFVTLTGTQTLTNKTISQSQITGLVTDLSNKLGISDNAVSATTLVGLTASIATLNNQSGTNTGDNSPNSLYSSLVSNATHSGDATGATVLTLATVNSNVGSFGSASSVATPTVNGKGLITAISNTPIQIAESQVTNLVTDLAAKLNLSGGALTGAVTSTSTITATAHITSGGTSGQIVTGDGSLKDSVVLEIRALDGRRMLTEYTNGRVDTTTAVLTIIDYYDADSTQRTWVSTNLDTIYRQNGDTTGGGSNWLVSASDSSIYYDGGNVGIDIAEPTEKLHMQGNLRIRSAANDQNHIYVAKPDGSLRWRFYDSFDDIFFEARGQTLRATTNGFEVGNFKANGGIRIDGGGGNMQLDLRSDGNPQGQDYMRVSGHDSTSGNYFNIKANGRTSIGNSAISSSVKFQVSSTTMASIPHPVMTEAQKNAITPLINGMHIFQSDGTAGVYVVKSGAWAFAY